MKLAELGEDRVVAALTKALPVDERVLVAAGDDCAVVRTAGEILLLKTDCVMENVHFTRDASPRAVGWKALCRAISDTAAMGGRPGDALITVALPPSLPLAWAQGLYAGLRRAATVYHVNLVGGETARSPSLIFVSVALTGSVPGGGYVTRAGGKPGDQLYVTGSLGGSIRGHHLTFRPRVEEALWLNEHLAVHAMMDLSDGLAKDLPRLARASQTAYRLDVDRLPVNRGCTVEQALQDGEDYELLFAVAREDAVALEAGWPKAFPRLTCVGELSAGRVRGARRGGFDHFDPRIQSTP
ncbi:MAG TPA: thiamine-phosphate kinase [Chthoniobacterales bacterium]